MLQSLSWEESVERWAGSRQKLSWRICLNREPGKWSGQMEFSCWDGAESVTCADKKAGSGLPGRAGALGSVQLEMEKGKFQRDGSWSLWQTGVSWGFQEEPCDSWL